MASPGRHRRWRLRWFGLFLLVVAIFHRPLFHTGVRFALIKVAAKYNLTFPLASDEDHAVASGELWILISDDGCGLKPRADRPGLGLGLGLISEVSDDFAVVSRATGGTEVRIRFNLVTADAAEPARAKRVANGSGIRSGFSASMSVA